MAKIAGFINAGIKRGLYSWKWCLYLQVRGLNCVWSKIQPVASVWDAIQRQSTPQGRTGHMMCLSAYIKPCAQKKMVILQLACEL